MRRLLVLLAVLALGVSASSAAGPRVPADGTLSVRDMDGRVVIVARGAVIGRVGTGALVINDPSDDDGSEPIVRGAERTRPVSETRTVYSGKQIRFRLIGGRFTVRAAGFRIYLSAVGRGSVRLRGDWGDFSLNGAEYRLVPFELTKFPLRAPAGG